MKLLIEVTDEYFNYVKQRVEENKNEVRHLPLEYIAISKGTPIPDNATRAQVFKKIFGMKIDTTGDCGFFDCSDILCNDCQIGQITTPLKDAYKTWWDAPYKGGE